jgi:SulP family sulfate permease
VARLDFDVKNIPADIASAAVSGLIAIPDAIASAILAGVSPTFAFNALMTGVPVGSLLTGTQFMNIGLTSAMMLAVADALADFGEVDMLPALFTLTLLIGAVQLLLGFFKLGRFTKFISNSVMVGFLTGVAVLVILSQLQDLTGYSSDANRTLGKAIDVLLHPGGWDIATIGVGLATVAMMILFGRTRLANLSAALAMVIGTVLVLILGLESVAQVGDTTQVSGAIPTPVLPALALIPSLLLSAFAIALIGLIQASGVSQTVPNPDGEYGDASRDFSAQGIANIVSGLFRGLPLGGSLGGTGIVLGTGAKSRWANVFVGLFVGAFVFLFASQVEKVAMPAIAGVLIVIGFQIINREEVGDIWDIALSKRVIMVVTFLATLVLPVQQAILVGIFISFIDYAYSSSEGTELIEIKLNKDNQLIEQSPPQKLAHNSITVLFSRGNSYFAAMRTLQEKFPDAKTAQNAVVIFRMRNSAQIGSTFVLAAERYAAELQANGGKLLMSGLTEKVKQQLIITETTDTISEDDLYMATEVIGESTRAAMEAARAWIKQGAAQETVENNDEPPPDKV